MGKTFPAGTTRIAITNFFRCTRILASWRFPGEPQRHTKQTGSAGRSHYGSMNICTKEPLSVAVNSKIKTPRIRSLFNLQRKSKRYGDSNYITKTLTAVPSCYHLGCHSLGLRHWPVLRRKQVTYITYMDIHTIFKANYKKVIQVHLGAGTYRTGGQELKLQSGVGCCE